MQLVVRFVAAVVKICIWYSASKDTPFPHIHTLFGSRDLAFSSKGARGLRPSICPGYNLYVRMQMVSEQYHKHVTSADLTADIGDLEKVDHFGIYRS